MSKLGKAVLGLALAGGLAFPMASASAQAICSYDDVLLHQNLTEVQRKVLLDEKTSVLLRKKRRLQVSSIRVICLHVRKPSTYHWSNLAVAQKF